MEKLITKDRVPVSHVASSSVALWLTMSVLNVISPSIVSSICCDASKYFDAALKFNCASIKLLISFSAVLVNSLSSVTYFWTAVFLRLRRVGPLEADVERFRLIGDNGTPGVIACKAS